MNEGDAMQNRATEAISKVMSLAHTTEVDTQLA